MAAALWYPYLAAPAEATRRWGAATYRTLADLARTAPESGVDLRGGRDLRRRAQDSPDWHADVEGFAVLDPPSTASAQPSAGWSFLAPVADMSVYLPWLTRQVICAGGVVEECDPITRDSLRDVDHTTDAVVVCAGLGSGALLDDPNVRPIRGQVVLLEQVGLEEWVLDESDPASPTYVVPRRCVVVCGGTAEPNHWGTDPDPATSRDILRRCRALVPALRDARLVDIRVGLRPGRTTVRLEVVRPVDDVPLVACYGHGGAGVTLSWGCADDVAALLDDLV